MRTRRPILGIVSACTVLACASAAVEPRPDALSAQERVLVRWLAGRASPRPLEAYRMRIYARGALLRRGPSIVPAMIALLDHRDLILRVSAAQILGTLGDSRAVPALVRIAESRRAAVEGRYVAHALGSIGDPRGARACRSLLRRSGDEEAKRQALWALGRTGSASDAALVESFLASPPLAAAAVEALTRIAHPGSFVALEAFVRSARQPGAAALGLVAAARLAGARALPLVRSMWERQGLDRAVILEAFGATRSVHALPYLLAALGREIPAPPGEEGARLRTVWLRMALVSLGELGQPQARRPLEAFLRKREPVDLRVLCMATLFRLTGDATYLPLLADLGVQGSEEARRGAISILAASGRRDCAPLLRRWAGHGSCWAMAEAIRALEKVEGKPEGTYAGLVRSDCSHLSHGDLTVAGDFEERLRQEVLRAEGKRP